MQFNKYAHTALIGAVAVLFGATRVMPSHDKSGPVLAAATAFVRGHTADSADAATVASVATAASGTVASAVTTALSILSPMVHSLSSNTALGDAFHAYYAYKTAHPSDVKNPYLYFVDYGLPSTTQRGYVFDMNSLTLVDGPFTVAHGKGSSTSQYGVPTKFSNSSNSHETSLGLYVTQALYPFTGHTGGASYSSIGLKLQGVSAGFNDNANARGVVAHGAPYVTPTKAGRSEGCPAMEPARAQRLLPEIANGGMVFLYAPNASWLAGDEWLNS